MQDIRRVTVVGGGLIGASWCALFLAHGLEVVLYDVAPDAEARVREELQRISPVLASLGLVLDPQTPRLTFQPELAEAVRHADAVQECGPERLAFKQALWAQVERHCSPSALLMSSSSGITASMQSRHLSTPERMLIAHPFNPPHLIPLVELVPGRRTDDQAMARAQVFFASLGKRVVRLRKEIPGFVANRIQAAVIRESVSLVRQGVVSVEDLDAAVTQSLGLRWAVGGAVHLGAPGRRARRHPCVLGAVRHRPSAAVAAHAAQAGVAEPRRTTRPDRCGGGCLWRQVGGGPRDGARSATKCGVGGVARL